MQSTHVVQHPVPDFKKIHEIIKHKPVSTLESLIKEMKIDVNAADSDGITMLHIAAQYGKLDTVKLLLKLGAVPSPTVNGFFPFHTAIEFNRPKIIDYFVNELKVDANMKVDDQEESYPLHVAAGFGSLEAMKKLMSLNSVYCKDSNGEFPLHRAVEYGHSAIVNFLVKSGQDVNQSVDDDEGDTPLHIATDFGHLSLAKKLMALGAAHRPNKLGHYPIHYAAECNRWDFLIFFVRDKKIDVNLPVEDFVDGNTPLHVAAWHGHLVAVKELSELGAEHKLNNTGSYPLHYATRWGHRDLIKFFVVEKRIAVNLQDETWDEDAPLHVAARYGQLDALKLLFELKATHEFNGIGKLPIHCAVMHGHLPVIDYLIKVKKVDVNVLSKAGGRTLLHYAAKYGQLDAARKLKMMDAHYRANSYGQTPLHDAASYGCVPLIRFFVKEMRADINAHWESIYNIKRTPLIDALDNNFDEAVKTLVDLKANITPACFQVVSKIEILNLLLAHCPVQFNAEQLRGLIVFFKHHKNSPSMRLKMLTCVLAYQKNAEAFLNDFVKQLQFEDLGVTYAMSDEGRRFLLSSLVEAGLDDVVSLVQPQKEYMLSRKKTYQEILDVVTGYKQLKPFFEVRKVFGFEKLPSDVNDHIYKFFTPKELRTTPYHLFKASRPSSVPAEKFNSKTAQQAHFFRKLIKSEESEAGLIKIRVGNKCYLVDPKYLEALEKDAQKDKTGQFVLKRKP